MKQACKIFCITLLLLAATVPATELKVDLNPPDTRKDILTPHWENWAWHEGQSGAQTFGAVTVTFRAATNESLSPVLFKAALDLGATMAADGVVLKNSTNSSGIEMVVGGLTSGKHTIATYHNEVRDHVSPAVLNVFVGDDQKVKGLVPTYRAANDYEVASVFLEVEAVAGKNVVIQFRPDGASANRSLIINGFEIDAADPHKKATKPSPANDDEHWPNESALIWTAPASAKSHQFYFGTDSNLVAMATVSSPEFKGTLSSASKALEKLDPMQDYFWRVDELDRAKKVTPGEVWHFRV